VEAAPTQSEESKGITRYDTREEEILKILAEADAPLSDGEIEERLLKPVITARADGYGCYDIKLGSIKKLPLVDYVICIADIMELLSETFSVPLEVVKEMLAGTFDLMKKGN
jgi:hypothetical protein